MWVEEEGKGREGWGMWFVMQQNADNHASFVDEVDAGMSYFMDSCKLLCAALS